MVEKKTKILTGVTAATGLAKGTACIYSEKAEENIPHYTIEKYRVENEISRLEEAVLKAKDIMKDMIKASEKLFDKRASEIFHAHLMVMLMPIDLKEKQENGLSFVLIRKASIRNLLE